MKMAKAPKEHVDKLRNWLQFNEELCKIDPTNRNEWNKFKEDWQEDTEWEPIIKHCQDDESRFSWEFYMDYFQEQISHIYMRIIIGYEVLVDNVCDPELDYLEYKMDCIHN